MKEKAGGPDSTGEKSWVGNFVLAWFVRFGFFFAFQELQPIFPPYLATMRASSTIIGAVMAAFAITSTIARAPVGLLIDRFGRKPFLLWGLAFFALATLGYIWAPSLLTIFLLRILHGVGWSAATTAIVTLAADIAPFERRGEMIGYAGMASNLGATLGPILGFAAVRQIGYGGAFLTSAAIVALSLVVSFVLREPELSHTAATTRRRWLETVIVPESFLPAATAGFLCFGYGGIIAFVPLYALKKGLGNPGLYFAVYAICLLLSRPFAGRLSDRISRRAIILPAYGLYLIGMLILALAPNPAALLIAAVLNGLGFGAAQPALMTLAVDRVQTNRRGLSIAQFQLFYDLGIGLGSLVLGALLDALHQNYSGMFLVATAASLPGLILYWYWDRRKSLSEKNSRVRE